MTTVPWLTLLWAIPVIGAVVIIVLPASARQAAKYAGLAVSLAVLVVAALVAIRFDPAGDRYQFVENHTWISYFGTGYILGVDGIALALVVLTAVLLPLLLIAGWNDIDDKSGISGRAPQAYVALMLAVEGMVLMSLMALDILLFYVFFEAMLIPMYFLIGGFGSRSPASGKAAVKFLLYNLFGGLVMLAGLRCTKSSMRSMQPRALPRTLSSTWISPARKSRWHGWTTTSPSSARSSSPSVSPDASNSSSWTARRRSGS